jgi:hypothetical protein
MIFCILLGGKVKKNPSDSQDASSYIAFNVSLKAGISLSDFGYPSHCPNTGVSAGQQTYYETRLPGCWTQTTFWVVLLYF